MGDDFTVLTGFLCAAASTRVIDGGNNKIRYRFRGGVAGVTPRTIQSSAQNVAAGVFPPTYSKVLFPQKDFYFHMQRANIL